jgi:hypothetical protein
VATPAVQEAVARLIPEAAVPVAVPALPAAAAAAERKIYPMSPAVQAGTAAFSTDLQAVVVVAVRTKVLAAWVALVVAVVAAEKMCK